MMNYIKSEFYRVLKIRNLFILIGICGALMMGLVFALKYFGRSPDFPYSNTRFALSNLYGMMNYMLMAAVVFSIFMYDNEEKQHTIKHSVAFGIPRHVIFIGRFMVQAVVCIFTYLILVGIYTALCYALLRHENVGELDTLIRVSIGSFTSLLAALAIAHFFLMLMESQSVAMVWTVAILVVLPGIGNLLGRKVDLVEKLMKFFPLNIVSWGGPLVFVDGNATTVILKCFLIGGLWVVGFLMAGIVRFQSKELK